MSPHFVYVGTGSEDAGNGIRTLRFDPRTGSLHEVGDVLPMFNPTFLVLSPDAQQLYAVSESPEKGTVCAYDINRQTGSLSFLNRQPTGGTRPTYVSLDQTGGWVFVANYGGGSVTLLPVAEDGSLKEVAEVVQHERLGPMEDRQEVPHAHYIHVSPDNRYAYAVDLGLDAVLVYSLDTECGSLEYVGEVTTNPGAGPRHLDFHPNSKFAYLVNELNGTVTVYKYDSTSGDLEPLQTLSAVPDDFKGENFSADIHVHPSGRWLYVSNRGDSDNIAIFSIDVSTGQLTNVGYQVEKITWPRNFAIAPTGCHMLVANRRANNVTGFDLDPETGRLTFTDHYVKVTEPTNVTFLPSST